MIKEESQKKLLSNTENFQDQDNMIIHIIQISLKVMFQPMMFIKLNNTILALSQNLIYLIT